ncbi:MAG: haloacid dehalogenase-like hydrolase [Bacilli bacterium]|nr:haloacid dehalogenase-like hydrolase [Bacilli bacterium]
MKLAIYDFDGTYVEIQTLTFLYKLWKKEHINDKAHRKIWRTIMRRYLFHKFNLFGWNKQTFRANAMELTADLFLSIDREALSDFLQSFYENIRPFISKAMKSQLRKDHEEGFHTVLLSGNYDLILKPFLVEGFDTVIGTVVETENGLLSSTEVEIIINQKKQEMIKEHFPEADYSASKAYADSDYDLPIFELVGHPICVNPDAELREIAVQRGYTILETKEKV